MALLCPSPSQFRQYWRDGPAMAGGRAERLVRPPYMDEEMKRVEGAGEGGTEQRTHRRWCRREHISSDKGTHLLSLALHGRLEQLKLAILVLGFHLTPNRLSVMKVSEFLHFFLCLKSAALSFLSSALRIQDTILLIVERGTY